MFPVPPCTVSSADPIDAQELIEVIDSSFAKDFHLNRVEYGKQMAQKIPERLADRKGFTVVKCVTREKKIVGTATGIWKGCFFQHNENPLPELGTLAVHPEYRGQKIAEHMIAAVEAEAKARNFRGMTLCHLAGFDVVHKVIDPRTQPLHNFYEKLGYRELEADGRLQRNRAPKMKKFITPENPSGCCIVAWMVKLFSEDVGVFTRIARSSPLSS